MVLRRRARTAPPLREIIPLFRIKQPLSHLTPASVINLREQDQLPTDQIILEPEARGLDQQAHADQDRLMQEIHRQWKGLPGNLNLLQEEIERNHCNISDGRLVQRIGWEIDRKLPKAEGVDRPPQVSKHLQNHALLDGTRKYADHHPAHLQEIERVVKQLIRILIT